MKENKALRLKLKKKRANKQSTLTPPLISLSPSSAVLSREAARAVRLHRVVVAEAKVYHRH
jgi:hypothetical protein